MVCAYGMAEATLAVSFHPWGTPLKVDTVLAVELEHEQRAVPAGRIGRRASVTFPVLGPPLRGIEVAVGRRGRQAAGRTERSGVLHLRGECVTDDT